MRSSICVENENEAEFESENFHRTVEAAKYERNAAPFQSLETTVKQAANFR